MTRVRRHLIALDRCRVEVVHPRRTGQCPPLEQSDRGVRKDRLVLMTAESAVQGEGAPKNAGGVLGRERQALANPFERPGAIAVPHLVPASADVLVALGDATEIAVVGDMARDLVHQESEPHGQSRGGRSVPLGSRLCDRHHGRTQPCFLGSTTEPSLLSSCHPPQVMKLPAPPMSGSQRTVPIDHLRGDRPIGPNHGLVPATQGDCRLPAVVCPLESGERARRGREQPSYQCEAGTRGRRVGADREGSRRNRGALARRCAGRRGRLLDATHRRRVACDERRRIPHAALPLATAPLPRADSGSQRRAAHRFHAEEPSRNSTIPKIWWPCTSSPTTAPTTPLAIGRASASRCTNTTIPPTAARAGRFSGCWRRSWQRARRTTPSSSSTPTRR